VFDPEHPMRQVLISAAVAAAAFVGLATTEASARFSPQGIATPTLVEQAACTVRRVRTVRPNGRVVYRTVRRCRPDRSPRVDRCRLKRERVVRPNGSVVYRTVRRCR
jgi:hypothetical protein